jgi:hypothetical protein
MPWNPILLNKWQIKYELINFLVAMKFYSH